MTKIPPRIKNATAYNVDADALNKINNKEELTKEELERYTVSSTIETFGKELKEDIRIVENYPKNGVTFYDLTPALINPYFLSGIPVHMSLLIKDIDFVVAPEARGFYFGPLAATMVGAGFIPMRKHGKVPPHSSTSLITFESKSEYGNSSFQINSTSISHMKEVFLKQKQREFEMMKEDMAADGTPSIQEDTVLGGQRADVLRIRVAIVDDVLATGNTAASIIAFFESMEIKVSQFISVLEIENLKGRELIESMGVKVDSLLKV